MQYSTLYILLWHSQCGLYASFEGGVLLKAKHYSLFASCTCNSILEMSIVSSAASYSVEIINQPT